MPRAYALFWWLTAAGWTMWTLARFTLSPYIPSLSETVGCVGFVDEPEAEWAFQAKVVLWQFESALELALPVLLLMLAWAATRRSALWPAVAGTALIAVGYLGFEAIRWISPLADNMNCGIDPDSMNTMSLEGMAWTFLPAVLVLLAARAQIAPFPWLPVGAVALTAALVAGAVLAVRLVPPGPVEQVLLPDGTPRYALVLSERKIVVADLQTGGEAGTVPTADEEFYNYRAVARDVTPGHYLAAASTNPPGSPSVGGRSRIYRITVGKDGEARVGEQAGPEFEGVVVELAAAQDGRIAYTRVSGDFRTDTVETAVGVVGRAQEWSTDKEQGLFDRWALGLHWSGPSRLTVVVDEVPGELDTGKPGADLRAATPVLRAESDFHPARALTVPGTRELVVHGTYGYEPGFGAGSLSLYTRGGKARGWISWGGAFTLDPSGRYLLVAQGSRTRQERVGDVTHIMDDLSYELVRIDLQAPGKPSAAPWSPDVTMLDLPEKVVWAAERDVSGLAW